MYLLYLDASGTPESIDEQYFVLGGVAAFERQTYWLTQRMNQLEQEYFPGRSAPLEFHASNIRARRGEPWKSISRSRRQLVMNEVYSIMAEAHDPGLVAFAAAIHKPSLRGGEQALPRAFEEVCRRFDLFLHRRRQESNDVERGLVIMDTCRASEKEAFRTLWTEYVDGGTRWGRLSNFADVPFFADSHVTRMLQLADFCSYAVYRRYEFGDSCYLDKIVARFDQTGGTIHGLVHYTRDYQQCWCPACSSRR